MLLPFYRQIAPHQIKLRPLNRSTYSWKCYCSRRGDAILFLPNGYFHGHFLVFTGVIFSFFHVQDFVFHGCKLTKIFTGKNRASRAIFQYFAIFFTGTRPWFTPKKKHCIVLHVIWLLVKKGKNGRSSSVQSAQTFFTLHAQEYKTDGLDI